MLLHFQYKRHVLRWEYPIYLLTLRKRMHVSYPVYFHKWMRPETNRTISESVLYSCLHVRGSYPICATWGEKNCNQVTSNGQCKWGFSNASLSPVLLSDLLSRTQMFVNTQIQQKGCLQKIPVISKRWTVLTRKLIIERLPHNHVQNIGSDFGWLVSFCTGSYCQVLKLGSCINVVNVLMS